MSEVKSGTMGRCIFLWLLMSGIAFTTFGQNNLKFFNLKGKVASVKVLTYAGELVNGKVEKDYCIGMNLLEFDEYGRLKADIDYDEKKNQEGAVKYEYDVDDHLVNQYQYEGKNLIKTTKFLYDAKGNLVEEKYYGSGGTNTGNTTYAYDSRGLVTEKVINDSPFFSRNVKTYDDHKLLTEERVYETKSGKQIWLIKHEYDSTGFETMISRKNLGNGVLLLTHFTFDASKNIRCEVNGTNKICRDYDENGNLVLYSGDGAIDSYDYTFDETGNWILSVKTRKNGKSVEYEIAERKIAVLKAR
jgi:hypothetical protein